MKFTLSLVFAGLLLAPSFGAQVPAPRAHREKFITKESLTPSIQQQTVGLDKCKDCIQFVQQSIQAMLEYILQVGVLDTCGDLCQAVATKTKSQALGAICNILCDIAGIEEFVKLINKEDPDPIYICEELDQRCPINDNGDAKFTTFDVMPKSGPQGDFALTFEYVSKNGTGTGEIALDIDTVDKIPLGQAFLHELAPAGTYNGQFKLRAEPDPDCDPTQGPCENWLPGDYTVTIMYETHALVDIGLSSSKDGRYLFINDKSKLSIDVDAGRTGVDNCRNCVDFADATLADLVNIIVNFGIIGSCKDLCDLLPPKTTPTTDCNALCDAVGITQFVKIIMQTNLDSISFCKLLSSCPVNDNGDAKLTRIKVTPRFGPQGEFDISFLYVSKNGTGTGQIALAIVTVDQVPVGKVFLHELAPAGAYKGTYKLVAKPDPSCDPAKGPCEKWLPGIYTVKISICNGECGSKQPHSQIYDSATTKFKVTK